MKILKFFISLSLILSVSLINSLAAISVSDGSAFVTKAEFAADLNNLSNRMSSLENSLDAKIDSLVSSYLSRNGIWNGEKQTLLDYAEKKLWPNKWCNNSTGNETIENDYTHILVSSKSGLANLFFTLDGENSPGYSETTHGSYVMFNIISDLSIGAKGSFSVRYDIAEEYANDTKIIFSKVFFNYPVVLFARGTIKVFLPSYQSNDFFFVEKGKNLKIRLVSITEGGNFNNSFMTKDTTAKYLNYKLKIEYCNIY